MGSSALIPWNVSMTISTSIWIALPWLVLQSNHQSLKFCWSKDMICICLIMSLPSFNGAFKSIPLLNDPLVWFVRIRIQIFVLGCVLINYNPVVKNVSWCFLTSWEKFELFSSKQYSFVSDVNRNKQLPADGQSRRRCRDWTSYFPFFQSSN